MNVALDQQIRIHDVYTSAQPPVLDITSQNPNVCIDSSANLVAHAQGGGNVELRWYDAAANGNLLATVNSGEAFATPIISADTTYYVSAAKVGCQEESPRVEVTVSTTDIPTENDIEVIGNENPICSSAEAILVPSSHIAGSFSWYFDATATSEITDGLITGGATYNIDSNGVLTISGLNETNGPYTFLYPYFRRT